jgi:hypothetical protein
MNGRDEQSSEVCERCGQHKHSAVEPRRDTGIEGKHLCAECHWQVMVVERIAGRARKLGRKGGR